MRKNDQENIPFSDKAVYDVYKKLGININNTLDIVDLARDYHEELAMLQQECLVTSAYIDR